MPERNRPRRILLIHGVLLPTLLFVLYFFTLAPRQWEGVDDAVVAKIAREHGREAKKPTFFDPGEGDLLLFAFLLAGVVSGFGAGYWWRMLTSGKEQGQSTGPADKKPTGQE